MKQIVTSNISIEDINSKKEINTFESLKSLSRTFFLLSILVTIGYSGILPFNYIATSYLTKIWYLTFN